MANRTINAHYDEANAILKMFVEYVDNNDLIFSYINSIAVDDFDEGQEVKEVLSSYGRAILNTGSNDEEEIVYTYKMLKYIVENGIPVTGIGMAYGDSNKYQDMVKGFGVRVVLPFVYHIESYLTDIAIDMGFDEETKYMITNHGGQVNIAKGQATINATQNNGINFEELDRLVVNIKTLLTTEIALIEREIINDTVEVLQTELRKENPKKGFIKTAISGLEGILPKIPEAVKLTTAIISLIQLAKTAF